MQQLNAIGAPSRHHHPLIILTLIIDNRLSLAARFVSQARLRFACPFQIFCSCFGFPFFVFVLVFALSLSLYIRASSKKVSIRFYFSTKFTISKRHKPS
jgi:hypothetical protein